MGDALITEYQQRLRERYLAATVMPAPEPWRPVLDRRTPVGGLLGIGFAVDPDSGHDLVMVVSRDGHGLFDAVTGEKVARDRDPDPDTSTPDASPELTCPGLGPIEGTPVRIAGLFGGGLHSTTPDGWTLDVVSPEWPTTASSSPPTAGPARARREGRGGTSSTPSTRNSVRPGSLPPA